MGDEQNTGYQIPEDLTAIEDLPAAEQSAIEAGNAISELDDPTDDQLTELEAIVAHVEAIRQEGARRAEAGAERTARLEAARSALSDPADAEGGEGESGEGESGGEGEGEQAPAEGEQAPEAVAAGATRRRAPSLVRGVQREATPARRPAGESSAVRATITASAGTHVEAGSPLTSMDDVVTAFVKRSSAHPRTFTKGLHLKHQVATFSRGDFGGLVDTNTEYANDPQALIDAAGSEKRLPGGSLTSPESLAAGGGWCAPSETLYDLVSMETNAGLIDLPEMRINRGGIRFTTGPDFSDIYTGTGFAQTEAQAIAETEKPCYEVDCPDFEEVRLDAVGLCIRAGILTNVGYPELVRRTLNGAFIAHQHKVSVRMINQLNTELGAAVTVPDSGSVARSTLTSLELAAEGQRAFFRMQFSETMEVKLPHWARVVLRDDLQARTRQVEPVTDAQLDAHFAARKLNVQFLYGYGDARIVSVPGGGTLLVDFPDTMPAMIYPAGTFVKGTQDVISLDTVYDTTDLQRNVYTAAFFEEAVLLARRAPGGGRLTIPVNSSGRVGPATLPSYGTADAA